MIYRVRLTIKSDPPSYLWVTQRAVAVTTAARWSYFVVKTTRNLLPDVVVVVSENSIWKGAFDGAKIDLVQVDGPDAVALWSEAQPFPR